MLAITGPRQSGKTTLARALFGAKPYVSLENPEEREFAQPDPRRFLARFTQSLANRVELLPLSGTELGSEHLPETLDTLLLKGGYHRNFGKRLVKTPKLYFLDVGLMAWLLGIRDAATIETHAARGALFETWVVSELIKQRFNAGQSGELFFWRDNVGHEVDVVLETPEGLQAIEIKSGSTFASDWPQGARQWTGFADTPTRPPLIIYGGADRYARQGCEVMGWRAFASNEMLLKQ